MPNTIETFAPPPSPPSFLDWLTGKRRNDINLPPESGQVDPRLAAQSAQATEQSPTMQGILQAAQNYKKIQSGDILGDILGNK